MLPVLKYIAKYLLLFFLFFKISDTSAQSEGLITVNARKFIDTLTSPAMHGRGYTSNGDKIAANYIRNYFKEKKLLAWPDNNQYYQGFELTVNTFPPEKNKESFFHFDFTSIDDETFSLNKPGIDYILDSKSPSFKFKVNNINDVIWIDSTVLSTKEKYTSLLQSDMRDKFIIAESSTTNNNEAKAILEQIHQHAGKSKAWITLNYNKLTATVSTTVSSLPEIEVLANKNFKKDKLKKIRIAGRYQNNFKVFYTSYNICGYIKGTQYPDSFIVFTAHYDHLGEMGGSIYFPGANDNASGTAMLLTLIDHYSKPENKPACSIAFIAFAGEELGLLGSAYYVTHPLFPLSNIKFLVNMDMMGTGDEGISVVNGSVYNVAFEKLVKINTANNYLNQIKIRGKAANSDHYFFSEMDVPCFYIYTMGNIKAYHDVYDISKTLPLKEFEDITHLLIKFVK